jgi:hypothetical protein
MNPREEMGEENKNKNRNKNKHKRQTNVHKRTKKVIIVSDDGKYWRAVKKQRLNLTQSRY